MLCVEFPQVQYIDLCEIVCVLKAVAMIVTNEHSLNQWYLWPVSTKVSPGWTLNLGFATQKKCALHLNRGVPSIEVTDTKIVWKFFWDQNLCPLNGGVPKDAKGVPLYKANKTHSNIICFTPHYIQEALQLLDFVLLSMLMVLDRHHQKANFLGLFHGARTWHKKNQSINASLHNGQAQYKGKQIWAIRIELSNSTSMNLKRKSEL